MSSSETVPTAVVDLWERLLNDDEGKDIELQAEDGSVRAHSIVLQQLSEPLKRMLAAGMVESQTRRIAMHDFKVQQLRFVLRLAYTGHADPEDWAVEEAKKALEKPEEEPPAAAGDRISPILLSRTSHSVIGGNRHGRVAALASDSDSDLTDLVVNDTSRSNCAPREPRGIGSVRGGDAAQKCSEDTIPLELYFGCASFAKRYEVPGFLTLMLERIKERLTISNFDEVMGFAIRLDLSVVKLYCLEFAKRKVKIRAMFDRRELSAQVEFELQALWAAPTLEPRRKRLRLATR